MLRIPLGHRDGSAEPLAVLGALYKVAEYLEWIQKVGS